MAAPQIDQDIVAALELARDRLAALIDSDRSDCRVGAADGLVELGPRCQCCGAGISDSTIKDAIRTYVQMWALFPFDTALAAAKGEASSGERSYLESVRRGLPAGHTV